MRRENRRKPKRTWFSVRVKLLAFTMAAAVWMFNRYVDVEIRPTLMQLAEYEARSITLQAIHTAVNRTLEENSDNSTSLCTRTADGVQIDTAETNRIRSALIQAVQEEMRNLPEKEYEVPFGSLTGNSLLNGRGPGWKVNLQPEGYVEAWLEEKTESLSINTTRYSASFLLSVTVNMILDGRTETLTVADSVPLTSFLLCGETPAAYAGALD